MRFAGLDSAAETHTVAVVDEQQALVTKPTQVTEDAAGYARLRAVLGAPEEMLVALEATGHSWQHVAAFLLAEGYMLALLNPLQTHRFGGEELRRAKTAALAAVGIARFAAQKRPAVTRLPDAATRELRELVRFRDRLVQDLGDRVRQLHRLVDRGFPEFPRHVRTLESELATTILQRYPTARTFRDVTPRQLANVVYDGRHAVGRQLAGELVAAAGRSVGQHHGPAYALQVQAYCEDIATLRRRIRDLGRQIERTLQDHEVGKLLTTIEGIGPQTAARLVAELGDPAEFRDAAALASHVGVVPATSQSGQRQPLRASLTAIGHARLRAALWMPTLTAVRRNPWLRAFYEGLRARGKLPKVALVAAMRKVLVAVYSVAKHRRPFVPYLRPTEVPAGTSRSTEHTVAQRSAIITCCGDIGSWRSVVAEKPAARNMRSYSR
jgi:transposase